MTSKIRTLDNLPKVHNKNPLVFLRLDLNVPMKNGHITDTTRIDAALPTIRWLMERDYKVVACSHLGRPKGKGYEKDFSLAPVAEKLAELLTVDVVFCQDYMEDGFSKITHDLKPNQFILLENLRFFKQEQEGDTNFAQRLSLGMDFYVNDAFGTSHRADASIVAVAKQFSPENRAAGLLVAKEMEFLESSLMNPQPPVVAIFGGSKVSDKIQVLQKFTSLANHFLIGGAMSYTFLKFLGHSVGASKIEEDKLATVEAIFKAAEARKVKIHLPLDHICGTQYSEAASQITCPSVSISDNLIGLDIGPKTQKHYDTMIKSAKLVIWNGPMGVFEWSSFAEGTKSVATSMSQCAATTIVGGGDTAAAVSQFQLANAMSHVSTGGGASLELLEGKDLPGISVLRL